MGNACRLTARVTALIVFAVVVSASAYGATNYSWVGGSGNWGTAANWSPSGVPGSATGDTADISASGTYTVSLDVSPANALAGVTIGNCSGCAPTLSVNAGRSINVSGTTGVGSASFLSNAELLINGGTFTGSGNIVVESGARITWPAGTISGSGNVQVLAGATVTMTNSNWTYLDTRTLFNAGTFDYTPNASYYWSLYNGATLNNSATFSILGDNQIGNSGSNTITNSGTFQKSGGSSTATIASGVVMNNSGTLAVSSGTLMLNGGGSSSGTINIGSGEKLEIPTGTFTLTGGTVTGAGDLRVTGGTLTVSANISVPELTFTNGTINGASPNVLTVTNLAWSGGTMGGSGKTAVSGTLTMTNTNYTYVDTRTLENNGTFNYTPGVYTFNLYNGSTLTNNGIFNALTDGSINASGTNTFSNTASGTVNKSGGSGNFTLNFGVVFNNSGALSVSSGAVVLIGTGTNSGGTWTIGASSTVDIPANTYVFSAGPTFTGSGALRVNGGTLTISAAAATVPKLVFSGGNINGSGTLNVADLTWSGGTMGGSGATVLTSTATFANANYTYLDTRTLTNNGTVGYTANSWSFNLYNGATFTNNGTFSFLDNGSIAYSGSNTFTNNGLLQKTGGTGSSQIQFGVTLNNTATGTLKVSSGTIALQNNATNAGTIDIAAAAMLDLPSGSLTMTAASFPSTGPLRVSGGTLTISGNVTIPVLQFTNGVINGASPNVLTVNSLTWSSGTMSGTGTTEVGVGGTATMTNANYIYLDTRTFTNKGTFNYTPGVYNFNLYNGATFNNQSVFDAQSDGVIAASGANTFNNSGTFQKSGGTGALTFNFGVTFNNTGTVDVAANSGYVVFNGGGASSGNFNAGSNAAVDVTGSTYTLNAGATITGAGVFAVKVGGTVNVNAAVSVPNLVLLNSGTINGSGTLTLTGANSKWGGGSMSGSGITLVNAGATLTIDDSGSNHAYLDTRTLNNAGTIVYNNPSASYHLYQYNGSVINNSGTFTATGDAQLYVSGSGTFNNSGLFQKNTATGTTNVYPVFNNTGTVSVASGIVAFNGNGTHTGAFTAGSGGTVTFANGTHAFNAGAQISGGGTAAFTAGTSTFSSSACAISPTPCLSPSTLALAGSGNLVLNTFGEASTLTLMNSATLGGSGTFTINGSATWGGGYMSGSGTTLIGGGATMTINNSGANYVYVDGRTINNSGTINYATPASSYYLYFQNNGVLNNNGTFNATSDAPINWASGAFNNNNIFEKTGGTGTTVVAVPFHNSGTATASAGTLAFTGGGTETGPFYANTALAFSSGTFNFNTGSEITGAGSVTVGSGTVNVSPASCPSSPSPCFAVGALTITGGLLAVNVTGETGTLSLSGSGALGGSGTFTINTSGIWGGGSMTGSGVTVIPAAATLTLNNAGSNYQYVDGRTINNAGSIAYTNPAASYYLYFQNGGVLNNSGTFTASGDAQIGSGGGTFNNSGSFTKTGGAGITDVVVPFHNSGLVSAATGTISFNGGGTHTGSFAVPAGLRFNGGTHTFNAGSQITGAGVATFNSGTVSFNSATCANAPQPCYDVTTTALTGSGIFNANAPARTTTFSLMNSGTLGGTSSFTINGNSTWGGGLMNGTGSTTLSSGVILTMDNSGSNYLYLDGRTINNNGTMRYSEPPASYYFYLYNNGTLNNAGLLDLRSDATIQAGSGAAINNQSGATIQKSVGTGTSTIYAAVNNSGTVTATTGTLNLEGGGTHAGAFTAPSGATLGFTGGTHTMGAGTSVSGAGTVTFSGGTSNFNSSACATPPCFDAGTTKIFSGQANFNAAATTAGFLLTGGGTLGGSGTFTITGTGTWGGGLMANGGTTVLGPSAVLALNDSGSNYQTLLDSRTLDNGGTINYAPSLYNFNIYNTAVVNNSGTFDLQGDLPIGFSATSAGIVNTGTFKKSGGSGTANIYAPLSNTGTIVAQSGTLFFNNTLSQTAGAITLAGGTLNASSPVVVNGGALNGSGTVGTSVVNNAQVNPGTSPGLITINGNYTQAAAAQMNVEIGGLNPGTDYDRLAVTGTATLDGTLNVTTINSFAPATGNTFSVLTFGTRSGDFAAKNMPVLGAGSSLNPTYTATSLDLVTNTVQADLAVSQGIAPPAISSGQAFDFAVTVTNNGGSNASSVTLTDTLPAGVTLNSITPAGICSGSGTVTCSLGALAGLASTTVTFNVTAPVAGNYTNTASATAPEFDPNSANNTNVQATAVVGATASLSLSVGDAPDPVSAGANITYMITVTNAGPDPASGVTLTDTLGSGASFVSAGGAGWTCGNSASTVTCTRASLAAGSSVVTVVAQASASATSIANSATVTASNAASASAGATTTVTPLADVAVSVTAPPSASAGGNVTFTVSVTNNGPSTAQTLSVAYPTPPGLSFVSAAGACNTSGSCSIASLAPSATVLISVTYSIPPAMTGTITQSATVSAATTDPTPGNNNASGTTTIAQQADLGVTISGPASTVAGSTISYTITVTNNGPSNVTNINVADPAPAGTAFVSNSGACTGAFPCTIAALNSGQSVTISATFAVAASFAGSTLTNAVAVSSPSAADPAPGNDSAQSTAVVAHNADLGIAITAPPTAGATVAFTVTVTNNGPSDAAGVTVSHAPSAGLTFASNSGACTTAYPCSLGTLTPGQSATFTSTYNTSGAGTVTNTVSASTPANDSVPSNNTASASSTLSPCPQVVTNLLPADDATNAAISGTLTWTADPLATSYNVYLSAGTACAPLLLGNTTTNAINYSNLTPGAAYVWRVESIRNGCPALSTSCLRFTAATNCPNAVPVPAAPAAGSTVSGSATFSWGAVAGATGYELHVNGALLATTADTTFTATLTNGGVTWFVKALFAGGCPATSSASTTFTVCGAPAAPVVSVVADVHTGATYTVSWTPLAGVTRYELDENGATEIVTGTSRELRHDVDQATPFFYRVRGIADCNNAPGVFSETVRVVVKTVPPPAQKEAKDLVVPVGSTDTVVQQIFVPGFPPDSFAFAAQVDKPWLNVTPATGILGPAGQTFTIAVDPTGLPNGTVTGTLLVSLTVPASASAIGVKPAGNPPPTVSVPVSVNLVTPVSSVPKSGPQPQSMFIPAVAHADGLDSKWQSDVRITNTGASPQTVQLFFTPSGTGVTAAKSTSITVEPGATIALDDIVKNWFGIGALGDGATGVLEIRPPAGGNILGASRTYNTTAAGTLGQFVPAVPFAAFVGRGASALTTPLLSMMQVAQSAAFRTNFGLLEATGAPMTAMVRVFDGGGNKLKETQLSLGAGEHKQLNSFLAANGVALEDGRIEVQPLTGSGKLMAYASVVDNTSGAPMLVTGAQVGGTSAKKFVVPGAADLNHLWRTDLRVFNPTDAHLPATLTFVPLGTPEQTKSVDVVVAPHEVKSFDGVVAGTFGLQGAGGAVQVSTGVDTPVMVSARTYAQTETGTYGQFIPAVTAAEAAGLGDKPLNILQIESSVRYRSNIGLVEVTGKPVTAMVTVIPPDAKFAPQVEVTLKPNEFLQLPMAAFDAGTVYNARVIVRVTGGQGRVAAYGSVVDMQTQAPTYVPGQ